MKKIRRVAVIGAGKMGSALAQKFAQEEFELVLADREMKFVENGIEGIQRTLAEGVERKVFTKEEAERTISLIKGTDQLETLSECDLIVEAIYEDFDAKKLLFEKLSEIVSRETVIATNTSSFSVDELAESVKYPDRFIGLHYFYHAAKNRLVEIVPGKRTSDKTINAAKIFSMRSGKDAIFCRDSYGFVVNRFFVPWLNESVKILDEKIADIATIDDVCIKVFGISMGPFALMNATGISVAFHAEKTLEAFGKCYAVSNRLKEQSDSGKEWITNGIISTDEHVRRYIADRLKGLVFFICSQLLDEKVCTSTDINRGARIGLRWKKGPVEMMREAGSPEVFRLISEFAALYNEKIPESTGTDSWNMEFVNLEKHGNVAVITMNRPEDLNALNEEMMQQLEDKFSEADQDDTVKTIYLTGSGKTFVAGADIHYFVNKIVGDRICDIEAFTSSGQEIFRKIDESRKKVIAIINGLALGGGLELALCADYIIALPKARMAFPETGIGIYPGLGGTFRCARKIGKGLSKYLIHTGVVLDSNEALEMGLADKIIDVDEMLDLTGGHSELVLPPQKAPESKWQNLATFFDKYSLNDILSNNISGNGVSTDMLEKISRTIRRKAPIAIRIADHLIDGKKDDENDTELGHIREVFSSSDALLGLSSIGKKIEYQGI